MEDDADHHRRWLTLQHTPGLGPVACRRLLAHFATPDALLAASEAALRRAGAGAELIAALARGPDAAAVDRDLAWLRGGNHHLVTLGDPRYPGDAGVLAERSALARRIVAVQERLTEGLQQIYLQRADLRLVLERLRTAKRLAEREDGEAPASLLALLEQGERLEQALNAQVEAARGPEEPPQGIVREQHLARDLRSVRRGLASTWGRPTERVRVELERVEAAAQAWSKATRGILERDLLVFRARFEEAGPGLFDWPLRD